MPSAAKPAARASSAASAATVPRAKPAAPRPAPRPASASAARPASAAARVPRGDVYEQAAHALLNADFVLIAAGAGFSADSGLPVYKDVANLPAYRDAGLDYGDLCVPQWARRDPTLFFGFWGSCYNNYFDASPHDGYGILHRWTHDVVGRHLLRRGASATGGGAEMGGPPTSFVYTSNVDCFFRRAGWDESQMLEIHGNI